MISKGDLRTRIEKIDLSSLRIGRRHAKPRKILDNGKDRDGDGHADALALFDVRKSGVKNPRADVCINGKHFERSHPFEVCVPPTPPREWMRSHGAK